MSEELICILDRSDLEGLKLLGVVQRFLLPYRCVSREAFSQGRSLDLPAVLYGTATAELFLGCLFFLDRHFWKSELQLSDPLAKAQLFSLLERCDREIFPVLADELIQDRQGGSGDKDLRTSLSWPFRRMIERERRARHLLRTSLRLEEKALEEAEKELQELCDQCELTGIYREVFLAVAEGVLNLRE